MRLGRESESFVYKVVSYHLGLCLTSLNPYNPGGFIYLLIAFYKGKEDEVCKCI